MKAILVGREIYENSLKVMNRIVPSELPDLIIFRILSYLPLSSLFKFKCVCKLWSTLFLHPTFLYLRNKDYSLTEYAKIVKKFHKNPDRWKGFKTICYSSHHLRLQKKITSSQTLIYRIQCHLLCDVFPIPNPQNPSLCIALEYVPIMSNPCGGCVKLISVYEDGNSNLGYEILSLEIGPLPCRWRPIDHVVPTPSDGRKTNSIQLFFRMGVAYCIRFVETTEEIDEIQVDVVDMVNETYIGRTTFPRERFMSTTLHLLDWNGRLSFSQLVKDKDELHVLVLNDHKKLKWAETKRIIKLHFLKSSPTYHKEEELITFYACADVSNLFFTWQDNKGNRSLSYYNIYTQELYSRKIYYKSVGADELVAVKAAEFAFHKAGL